MCVGQVGGCYGQLSMVCCLRLPRPEPADVFSLLSSLEQQKTHDTPTSMCYIPPLESNIGD